MSKEQKKQALFEQTFLPHIDAAFNLARWIVANDQDAEDIVQESYLRAFKYFTSYQGGNGRSWLLAIVRNACYSWLEQNKFHRLAVDLDETMTGDDVETGDPDRFLQKLADRQAVARALEELPAEYRELIVLRELEDMSYKEIAQIAGIPMGTVMSRLARARQRLKECLGKKVGPEDTHEL